MDLGDGNVLLVTDQTTCVFLQADLKCAIYEDRPEVCEKFGNEEHLNLTCRFQRKNGEPRSYFERQRLDKLQIKAFNKFKSNL